MNKKSLFHISKRDTLPWYTNVAIRGGAIILALVVCALVTTILTGENPLSIYGTILKGRLRHRPQELDHLGKRGHSAGHLPGGDPPPSRCASGTSAPRARSSSAVWPPPPA